MIAPAFYRSLLTPAEQLAYRQLVTGLLTGKGTIFIPQGMVPTAQLHRVVQAVHLDHPELFEIQWWETGLQRCRTVHISAFGGCWSPGLLRRSAIL